MKESALQRLHRLENRLRRRRVIPVPRKTLKNREDPIDYYSDETFKRRFHIYKDTALYITNLIATNLCYPLKRGLQLLPVHQFLIAQRFFVTGSFQIVIGDVITLEVSQSTVSKVVKRVSYAVAKLRPKYINFPTHEEAPRIREKFYAIGQFPGVVGAIDCCQIDIVSPGRMSAELFRNRKGDFAINVQAICCPDLNFTNIVARWYGSAHDSRIFENSEIGMDMEEGRVPGLLLGDSGYGLTNFLMTPLSRPSSPAERRYNVSQKRTRNTIERCFGVWKRRFPCLKYLRLKLETSLIVIVATAVIHNISRKRLDLYEDDTTDEIPRGEEIVNTSSTISGKATQRCLIQSHFS